MLTKVHDSRKTVKRSRARQTAMLTGVSLLPKQEVARTAPFAGTPYRLPCSSVKNASYGICGVNKAGEALLCVDAPWKCPYSLESDSSPGGPVPPACNTGVHTPVESQAQLFPSGVSEEDGSGDV